MPDHVEAISQVASTDRSLVAEALHRVKTAKSALGDSEDRAVVDAIIAAMQQGRRDLCSLVKAGKRAAEL